MAASITIASGPAAARKRRRWTAAGLVTPATLLVVGVLLLPLVLLFRYSLNQFIPGRFMVEALTLDNYVSLATDPYYQHVMTTTLWMATLCTVICVIAGFPAAYVLARAGGRWKTWLLILVVLPLFVGNAVRAAGWMVLLGNSGLINSGLKWMGLIVDPIKIMYSPVAVVIGITAVNLPFMVLTLQSVIEGIDRHVEEAALSLGAGPIRTFLGVTLPLAMPGVIAGTILVFILGMNAYATPVLLGGPQFQMMAPTVYQRIVGQANWPFGAALAFVLMAATLILTTLSHLLVQRRYRSMAGSA
jgi:putative spermidine/putrescine transport system permease protein